MKIHYGCSHLLVRTMSLLNLFHGFNGFALRNAKFFLDGRPRTMDILFGLF